METAVIVATFYYYFDFFLKCVVSLFLGGIIGYERAVRKKPAGVRTHALICVGACMLTFLSFHFSEFADPARIAAQIVSGIGFIGAGTIFVSRQRVQGLTSAATVWVCAAVGMMVGANMTVLAIISVLSISLMLVFIKSPFQQNGTVFNMLVQLDRIDDLSKIDRMIKVFGISVDHRSLYRDNGIELKLQYKTTAVTNYFFFKRLCQTAGIKRVYQI